ncbi:YtxH domain-containing protein [Ectobacillus ponti]|uniref:YtxH domain-containing protein n=1 Tax=Ectobacillus ponti TaxID=2961894 RepID=A0AA41X7R3_9BACI|nr:YtxH domain-containing protein [Ectobacillus ponti]MCP8968209.1 YtxH domain-containing protein [Ectobacillus ponti]
MSKTKAFAAGVLFGSVAAGIAALLTAPSSGRELRKKVAQKGIELKGQLDGFKDDTLLLKEQAIQTVHDSKEVFIELKDDMQKALSSWKAETAQNKENIQKEIDALQRSIEELQKSLPDRN